MMRGYEVVPALVEVVNRAGAGKAYHELPSTFSSGPFPMHLVRRLGGAVGDAGRSPRFVVDTYAQGLAATERAAEQVRDALAWAPAWQSSYHGTRYGLIDDIVPVAEPAAVPFSSDTVRMVSVQYTVDFRDS